ncbi:MAG: PAS domain-containing protein [Betaproteobacteria bacterium]|nr:PAS domain-containing protein [Betaproteobacteria bacterium]
MAIVDTPRIAGWNESHERELTAMQVDELYRYMPFATGGAFLSAGLTLAVLNDTGAGMAGMFWFVMFSLVTLYRVGIISAHSRDGGSDPAMWARLAIAGNVASGVMWGILGTLLFPATASYRELFIVMVICANVGGSISTYAAVKWAHPAVTLPAVVPPIFYLTFMRDGMHIYSALTAFVFMILVTGIALQQHRRITQRLRLILENRELMRRVSAANSSLMKQNSDLEQQAVAQTRVAKSAKDRADLLTLHFANTPLAIIECDDQLNLVAWNDAAQRLMGHRIDTLRGKPLLPAICVDGESGADGDVAATIKKALDNSPLSVRGHFVTLDRRAKKGSFHITPIRAGKDQPVRLAIVISDWRDSGTGNNGDVRQVA